MEGRRVKVMEDSGEGLKEVLLFLRAARVVRGARSVGRIVLAILSLLIRQGRVILEALCALAEELDEDVNLFRLETR